MTTCTKDEDEEDNDNNNYPHDKRDYSNPTIRYERLHDICSFGSGSKSCHDRDFATKARDMFGGNSLQGDFK